MVLATAMAAVSASPAAADVITFAFTGTVTQFNANDPDIFGGLVGFGTTFSGTYTFDSTAPDGNGAASGGAYVSPYDFTVDFDDPGTGAFSVTGFSVVTQNAAGDFYGVYGNDGTWELEIALNLVGAALGSDALPLTPPALAAVTFGQFTFRDATGLGLPEILGTIDSLTCTDGCDASPIPEPGTLLLLSLGVGGSALQARRRTRGSQQPTRS